MDQGSLKARYEHGRKSIHAEADAIKAGLPYKKNAFRNSYISYRLAEAKDINAVAYEIGNSPKMIRKYYLDLVTPEQAKAWFSL